jgi:hypothetical protein
MAPTSRASGGSFVAGAPDGAAFYARPEVPFAANCGGLGGSFPRSHSSASNDLTTRRAASSLCTRMMSKSLSLRTWKMSFMGMSSFWQTDLYGKGKKT